jgi:hypothetical protein
MKRLSFLFLLAIGLVLVACSSTSLPTPTLPVAELTALPPTQPLVAPTKASPALPAQPVGKQATQLAELFDSQGAITVIVKPLDLNSSPDALCFEVTLVTHSIDLSMDLAALATLMTDTGQSVQATLWDAPLSGHDCRHTGRTDTGLLPGGNPSHRGRHCHWHRLPGCRGYFALFHRKRCVDTPRRPACGL